MSGGDTAPGREPRWYRPIDLFRSTDPTRLFGTTTGHGSRAVLRRAGSRVLTRRLQEQLASLCEASGIAYDEDEDLKVGGWGEGSGQRKSGGGKGEHPWAQEFRSWS